MNSKITRDILETVGSLSVATGDIVATLLESPYGASYNELHKNLKGREARRTKKEAARQAQQKFYSAISRLKQDGLIQQEARRWQLTSQGKKKLSELKQQPISPFPVRSYRKTKVNHPTLVIFDIPEKERRKRYWLRTQLRALGFTMLQKSVWLSTHQLPLEFVEDLSLLKLLPHVHIFSIHHFGTLESTE